MTSDSLFNQSDEEDDAEDREMYQRETALTGFLNHSNVLLDKWLRALTMAKFHHKLKHYPGLDALFEKVVSFTKEKNQLYDEYEGHLKHWDVWEEGFVKRIDELERWEVEEEEME